MALNSLGHPFEEIHQFGHFSALISFVARGDGVLDTMGDMIAQDVVFDAVQRSLYRVNLGDDVNAITVFIDHFGDASNLTFDAIKLFANARLDVVSHAPYIPPMGI